MNLQSIINLMRVIMSNPHTPINTFFRAKVIHDNLGGTLYRGDEMRKMHDEFFTKHPDLKKTNP
jgi:hypothetical protein